MPEIRTADKLNKKYLREEIDLARSSGKKIDFHIDGKIDNMIPDFVEMGVELPLSTRIIVFISIKFSYANSSI